MKSLKIWVWERLPVQGDRLPVCGKFYRNITWTGAGPLPYPNWFIVLCRIECWVIMRMYRWATR